MVKKFKIGASVLALSMCGYVFADAWDIAPGFLTLQPEVAEALDYPHSDRIDLVAADLPEFTGTAPAPADLERIASEYMGDEDMEGMLGMIVQDPFSGERLLDLDGATALKPASNQKYLTAVAALHELGPDTTFDTTVKIVDNTLYLVGGGDVLLARNYGTPGAINGRAGLADLADLTAEALNAEGITSVNLVVDSSLFSGPLYPAEIEGTVNAQYLMEMRPLAIDRSRIKEETWEIYTQNPDVSAAKVFAEHLKERGIEAGDPSRGRTPDAATDVASVSSAPVRQWIEYLMVHSDNTVAEVLGHMIAVSRGAPGDYANSAREATAVLVEAGYPMQGVVIDDLSGLSDNNRVTPELLAYILQEAWNCNGCETASLAASLPVANLQGTLDTRFDDSLNEGYIRAKTGTLLTATTLAGYMQTESGYPLIFVVLNSGHSEGYARVAREIMDEALEKIAAL